MLQGRVIHNIVISLINSGGAQHAYDSHYVIFVESLEFSEFRVGYQQFRQFVAGEDLFPYVVHMVAETAVDKRMELFYVLANLVYDTFFAGIFGLFYV